MTKKFFKFSLQAFINPLNVSTGVPRGERGAGAACLVDKGKGVVGEGPRFNREPAIFVSALDAEARLKQFHQQAAYVWSSLVKMLTLSVLQSFNLTHFF